jgi:hypothetical protein
MNFSARPPLRDPRTSRTEGRQQSMVNGNETRHYSAQDARGNRDDHFQEQLQMIPCRAPADNRQPVIGFLPQVNNRGTHSRTPHDATHSGGMAPPPDDTRPFHNENWANSWTMGALTTIAAN